MSELKDLILDNPNMRLEFSFDKHSHMECFYIGAESNDQMCAWFSYEDMKSLKKWLDRAINAVGEVAERRHSNQ